MSITIPTIRLNTNVPDVFRVNAEPIAPMTPPKMKKEIILPPWNISCGFILSPSFAKVADIDKSSPPTTAMQLESEATMPIANAVP